MDNKNTMTQDVALVEALIDQATNDACEALNVIRKEFQEYGLVLSGAKGGSPESHIKNLTDGLERQEQAMRKTFNDWKVAFAKAASNTWDTSQSIEDLESKVIKASCEIALAPKGSGFTAFPGIH